MEIIAAFVPPSVSPAFRIVVGTTPIIDSTIPQ
jgi:hypothetical protein